MSASGTAVLIKRDETWTVQRIFADVAEATTRACSVMPRALSADQREDLALPPLPSPPPCGRPTWRQEQFSRP